MQQMCHAAGVFSLSRPSKLSEPVKITTAEACGGPGGAWCLRGSRAAAAPRPGSPGANPGPRALLNTHRAEQLGVGTAAAREAPRGASALCCGFYVAGQLFWKKQQEDAHHFRFRHL